MMENNNSESELQNKNIWQGKRILGIKPKKNIMVWVAIIIVIIVASLFFKWTSNYFGNWFSGSDQYVSTSPNIAVLYVEGAIMSTSVDSFQIPVGYQHQWTLTQIDVLINDPYNKAIMIVINSPGGGVYESDELYLKLKEYHDQTGRPIYSTMGSMAASGGYYIATASDKIYANRNTWTGSIGVTIGTFYDISEFLAKNGVKTRTINSGTNKAMGSMTDPMTAEQLSIFQSLVNEAYEQFVGIVAKERKMDLSVVKKLADGRIYTAKQALSNGLVDAIGTKEEAMSDLVATHKLSDCEIIELTYTDNSFLGKLLSSKLPSLPMSDTSAILQMVNSSRHMPISYTFAW